MALTYVKVFVEGKTNDQWEATTREESMASAALTQRVSQPFYRRREGGREVVNLSSKHLDNLNLDFTPADTNRGETR